MRIGPHRIAVEEYIVKHDGSEEVTKRWESMMACSLELGLDHRTIRNRIKSKKGQLTSFGLFKYRKLEGN